MTTPSPLLIGFDGSELTPALSQYLKEIDPAGVVFFQRNIISIQQTKQLIQQIKELLGNVIVAIDHEGGVVSRFPAECPVPPSPAAIAYEGSLEMIQKSCRIQAELLSYLGFNLNFAPAQDLSQLTGRSILGPRVYSSDPKEVGRYGKICIAEHQKRGIGATAKHFPGHGHSLIDTHFAAGVVDKSEKFLRDNDLIPFFESISAQVPAIMSAHLTFSDLDPDLPATLSRKILYDLLRMEMGFKGLVITDCVEMSGLCDKYSPRLIIQKGIVAGVDLWISSYSLKRSLPFQRELKRAWIELSQEHPEEIIYSKNRLKQFLKDYSLNGTTVESPPDMAEVIEIHKKTIQKVENRIWECTPRGIFLVELKKSNSRGKGINAEEGSSPLIESIKRSTRHIKLEKIIPIGDVENLQLICETVNQQNLLLVLLTSDAWVQDDYKQMMSCLKTSECSLHIALMEEQDLTGFAHREWCTRGYCKLSGQVLGEELDKLI
ncbi:MAG: glycoside hydrolase family 3 protein [Proteobacteria bacterium]|nr:glycoside hydrolase family 3 protein [Pseudomonadota bacterium]